MIRVNDDWVVDVDPYNYILKKDLHRMTKDRNGNPIPAYDTQGHFSSLQAALERLGEEMVREKLMDGARCLAEAVDAIRECRDEWRDLIGRIEA